MRKAYLIKIDAKGEPKLAAHGAYSEVKAKYDSEKSNCVLIGKNVFKQKSEK